MDLRNAMYNFMGTTGSLNETRRDAWVIDQLGALPAGSRLLDAGAGECRYRSHYEHLDSTTQDFAQYDGTGGAGLQTGTWDTSHVNIVSDIAALPIATGSFDAVLCTEVLEHVVDPNFVVAELGRVLRPGGSLIVTAPFRSLTHFAPYHYATGFSRFWYETVLPPRGLDVVSIEYNGNLFESVAQEVRRLPSVTTTYGSARMNLVDKILMAMMVRRLRRFAESSDESAELDTFGLHVIARKRMAHDENVVAPACD